jgi:hypothetical protein
MEKEGTQNKLNKIGYDHLLEIIEKQKRKRPPTPKAKWYIEQYPDINEAFSHAKCEDRSTLESIYYQGVDINYDVETANKRNMFYCAVTAHGACDPHFLKMMFLHGRMDIKTDGQHVFEMVCAFGDTRHVSVFMSYHDEYKWNIFEGMRSAVLHGNRDNLHHLRIYIDLYRPSDDDAAKLWNLANDGLFSRVPMLLYFITFFGCTITKERLVECMPDHFFETFTLLTNLYLCKNEPFVISVEIVDKIIKGTDDRVYNLKFLKEKGFEIEGFEEIKNTSDKDLPKPSCTRYYTKSM